jgi:two-component system response regulator MprA
MDAPRKILVVDDDKDVRRMIADVLGLGGYDVATAADGVEALAAVAADPPDCVVLDVMMPNLDGYGVLAELRTGDGPHLPVVMLTAHADDSQAWKAWTEGVDYFLAKPFDADELLRWLDYLFSERRAG